MEATAPEEHRPTTRGRRADEAFEGWRGTAAARVMARLNADMEHAAVGALPEGIHDVLVLGFGPGVGLVALLDEVGPDSITALDPSAAMVRAAASRLAGHPGAERVRFVEGTADRLPPDREVFDAAIAVNCQQLWWPHRSTLAAVAGSLRRAGSLVTLTHRWAIVRHRDLEEWKESVRDDLAATGFGAPDWWEARYRSGQALGLRAVRAGDTTPSDAARDQVV